MSLSLFLSFYFLIFIFYKCSLFLLSALLSKFPIFFGSQSFLSRPISLSRPTITHTTLKKNLKIKVTIYMYVSQIQQQQQKEIPKSQHQSLSLKPKSLLSPPSHLSFYQMQLWLQGGVQTRKYLIWICDLEYEYPLCDTTTHHHHWHYLFGCAIWEIQRELVCGNVEKVVRHKKFDKQLHTSLMW